MTIETPNPLLHPVIDALLSPPNPLLPPQRKRRGRRTQQRTAPSNHVIGYLRVSTREQADSGAGLDAQKAAILEWAARNGKVIVAWFIDEGRSGKDIYGREEFLKAIDVLARGQVATGLVVSKLDRVARSLLDFIHLVLAARHGGWNLVMLDIQLDLSTPTGELVANILAAVAQWERQIIAQRTREGLAAKKAAGVRLGAPRTADDAVLLSAIQAYSETNSWSAAARHLAESGVPTPTGRGKWYPASVQNLVQSQDGRTLMATLQALPADEPNPYR